MKQTTPALQAARYQVEQAQRPGFAWITDTQQAGPVSERAILFFGTAQEAETIAAEWNAVARTAEAMRGSLEALWP